MSKEDKCINCIYVIKREEESPVYSYTCTYLSYIGVFPNERCYNYKPKKRDECPLYSKDKW